MSRVAGMSSLVVGLVELVATLLLSLSHSLAAAVVVTANYGGLNA